MHDLHDLWRSLEVVPGLAATRKEWQIRTGGAFPLLEPALQPVGSLAECMPCMNRQLGLHYHDVVEHRDGSAEAVLRSEYYDCPSFPVERHERAILAPDMEVLGRQIAIALGIEPAARKLDIPEDGYELGRYQPVESFRFPTILSLSPTTVTSEESLLCSAAMYDGPFIFLTGTPKSVRGKVEAMLTARNVLLASLEESVTVSDDHVLSATPAWTRMLTGFRRRVVPKPGPVMAFFETPPNARWRDVSIRFVDGHTVFVSAAGVSGRYSYIEMGMANSKASRPSVRWDFLRELSGNNGSIDFEMGNPDKNKSWKNGLSDDLRRFFHIADDPFIYDKTSCCWQAKFAISPE